MSKRKPFNDRAGYIASLRSGANRGWVVIYKAEDQGLDLNGENHKELGLPDLKYAVVCETHFTLVGTTSIPKAREIMKAVDFCEACLGAA